MPSRDILDAALLYARRGWRVFALDGKIPFAGTKGFLDATADENKIRDMFTRWPLANVGIATGSVSGFFVVDVDGDVGADSWKTFQTIHGAERETLSASTRRGKHYYYLQPPGIGTRNQASGEIGQGVDIRGDGGYVVAPPSIHPDDPKGTNSYRWLNDLVCTAPSDALLGKVRADRQKSKSRDRFAPQSILQGSRDAELTRIAGQLRWLGLSAEEIYNALSEVNKARCKPPLEDNSVLKIAKSIGSKDPGKCSVSGAVTESDLVTLEASSLHMKPTTWRWPGFMPRGAIVIWAGDPGHGKSLMSCYLAAKITRGEKLVGDDTPEEYDPEKVLFLSAEDNYEQTMLPRLHVAKADMSRVSFIDARMSDGRPVAFPDHLTQLTKKIEESKISIVIIDPFDSFLGDGVDSYKNSDVRKMLAPMKSIAETTNVIFLIIMHLNKAKDSSALHRVGGSGAFVAAPRASFVFGSDPTVEGEHIFACAKINIAKKPKSLRFALEEEFIAGVGDVARIAWRGESSETADSITMMPSNGKPKQTARDGVKEWLKNMLKDGPVAVTAIQAFAKAAQISPATLRRAKDDMDLSFREVGKHNWQWALKGYTWKREPGDDDENLFSPED